MKIPDIKNFFHELTVPEQKISSGFTLVSKYRSAIMGFAALWILIFHVRRNIIPLDYSALEHIEYRIKRFGYSGVDIFFFLSGMGLTFAIGKTSLPVFYYRRLKRIILPFLTVALIRLFLENWPMETFIDNVTGRGFYTRTMYSFLWFVPAIVTFYILFPLYWQGFRRTGAYFWTVLSLVIWLFLILGTTETMRGDLYGFINRIPVFLTGILFGHLTQTKKNIPFKRRTYILIALIFALGLYFMELTNFRDYYLLVPSSNCCVPTFIIAVTFPFVFSKILNELECHRVVCVIGKAVNMFYKFFGSFSMELYCLQEWYADMKNRQFADLGLSAAELNRAILPPIIIISFAASVAFRYFWKLVELPFARKASGNTAAAKKTFADTESGTIITESGADYLESVADRMEKAVDRIEKAAAAFEKIH